MLFLQIAYQDNMENMGVPIALLELIPHPLEPALVCSASLGPIIFYQGHHFAFNVKLEHTLVAQPVYHVSNANQEPIVPLQDLVPV